MDNSTPSSSLIWASIWVASTECPADLEEIVVDAYPFQSKRAPPDFRQLLLQFRAGRNILCWRNCLMFKQGNRQEPSARRQAELFDEALYLELSAGCFGYGIGRQTDQQCEQVLGILPRMADADCLHNLFDGRQLRTDLEKTISLSSPLISDENAEHIRPASRAE